MERSFARATVPILRQVEAQPPELAGRGATPEPRANDAMAFVEVIGRSRGHGRIG